jgi:hypothetical protein
MGKRERRVVERPRGIGNLKKGNEIIAGVTYSIIVSKDIIIINNFDGYSEVDGVGQINGRLKFVEKDIKIEPDEIYTLELADGREFDISIPLANFPSKEYEFILRDGKNFKIN